MNVVFTPTAWEQFTDWQKEDKKIVKRINEDELRHENPVCNPRIPFCNGESHFVNEFPVL